MNSTTDESIGYEQPLGLRARLEVWTADPDAIHHPEFTPIRPDPSGPVPIIRDDLCRGAFLEENKSAGRLKLNEK